MTIKFKIEIDDDALKKFDRDVEQVKKKVEKIEQSTTRVNASGIGSPIKGAKLPSRTFIPPTGAAPAINRERFLNMPIFGNFTGGMQQPQGGAPFQPVPEEFLDYIQTPIAARPQSRFGFLSNLAAKYKATNIKARHVTTGIYQTKGAISFGLNPTESLIQFAFRFVPILMPILVGYGLIDMMIKVLFGPGGPLDTRFKEFEARQNKLISRKEEAERRQGMKIIRYATYFGLRNGENQVATNIDRMKLDGGQTANIFYDRDLHMRSKGL